MKASDLSMFTRHVNLYLTKMLSYEPFLCNHRPTSIHLIAHYLILKAEGCLILLFISVSACGE